MLWNNHKKVKKVLCSVENREKVALDLLMDNHFKQLSNSFSTKEYISYGNVIKEFNAASIRTAHFVTGLYIGLGNLVKESCDVGTKKLIESIRSYFIDNPSNVALFNEQIKKISQGENEMPKTQNFKNPQETAINGSDVKANDNIVYPVEQQTSGTICTVKSSEYENDDDQASSPECSENTFQNQYLKNGLSLKEAENKISEGINLTLNAHLHQHKIQLVKEEGELGDLRNRVQELEQNIENLNHQKVQLEEKMGLVAAQKLEQEGNFEQAQQEINNLTEKFKREQKLHRHTSSKAHAQLAEKERELIDSRERIQQLEQVMENPNGKLEQAEQKSLSQQKVISDQSRKQTNYASASFVLAGMFAIGASCLTPYLAVCIILAVAASIFLIAGGCCLYKANTAFSDVKADQIPGVVGALNCNSSGLI